MTFAYVWPDGVVRRIRPGGPAQHVAQLQAHEAEHQELKEKAFMMQIVIKDQDDKIKELEEELGGLRSMKAMKAMKAMKSAKASTKAMKAMKASMKAMKTMKTMKTKRDQR